MRALATKAARPEEFRSWRRAWLWSLGVWYGPFLIMGVYTLMAVACQHCRETVWKCMAVAPGGMLALLLTRPWRAGLNDAGFVMCSVALCFALTGLLAWWVRRPSRATWPVLTVATVLSSVGAVALLRLIRA